MTFLGLTGLINFISCLSIGLFVFLKNFRSAVNRAYFYGNLSICIYSLGYYLWQLSRNSTEAMFWFKILTIGIILINVTYIHFVFTFVGILKEKRKMLNILYGINIIIIILNLKFLPFYHNLELRYGLGFWPNPTIFFHFYLFFWLWECLYGFDILFRKMKMTSGLQRERIKYFALAAAIGFCGGATNWPMWYRIYFPPYLNILISAYAFIIAYAILKYHLLDIKIALTRAGVFLFVYFFVLGIPFWIGYVTKAWFLSTSLAIVLATLGVFIYNYLRQQAEELLLKEQRRYQRALKEAAKEMSRIRDLDKLLQALVLTVVEEVKVSFACIYLKNEEYRNYQLKHCFPLKEKNRFSEFIPEDNPLINQLNQYKRPLLSEEIFPQDKVKLDSGLVIPCFLGESLLGIMFLGAKPNHQAYTSDDLVVFETLSYSTSLAIENCLFWKEFEEQQRKTRIAELDLFSYSLAHEIDNPLMGIKTATTYLKDFLIKEMNLSTEIKKEFLSTLNSILANQERISAMIKAIEEFGKKTAGEFYLLDLEEVIKSYLELYQPQFKYHGIIFTQEVPDKLPYIRGSKQELMQVLVNLSNNAIHALLNKKEKRIHLKVEIPNEETIRIIFRDNGYGIPPEKLSSIFAAFTTTKASTEGRGMGLYVTRKIIERHRGKIWAESEGKDKGAVFFIELPIAKNIEEEFSKEEVNKVRLF